MAFYNFNISKLLYIYFVGGVPCMSQNNCYDFREMWRKVQQQIS